MARNFSLVANVRLAPHLPNILAQLRLRVSIKGTLPQRKGFASCHLGAVIEPEFDSAPEDRWATSSFH
jgi:hypothetical protein